MRRTIVALLMSMWMSVASAGVNCTLPFNLQNNTTADVTQVMANYNALVACLGIAAHAGSNTDITALLGLTTPLSPGGGGATTFIGGTSTGTANAQVVATALPNGFALVAGYRVVFIAGVTNNNATTLNVAGTGIKNVTRYSVAGPIALTGGEIVATNIVEAVYDGTQFVLYTSAASIQTGGYVELAGAITTDLGSVPSHNVAISGTATITSFGSTAIQTYPIYNLIFTGASTLTYNAASMILTGGGNITTANGDTATAIYLGSGNWLVDYHRFSGTSVVNSTPMSGTQGLLITNNAGTPSTAIDVSADQVVLINPSGNVPVYASATGTKTINCTVTGANGLDAGSLAINTWYNIFLIYNGTTLAGLASTSATAPTLPTGYTYRVRVGAMRTDGSANFYRTRQQGSHAVYTPVTASNTATLIPMSSGSSAAWTAIPTGNFVPPTATQIKGVLSSISMGNNTTSSVAPNNNYPTTSVGNAAGTPWSITNSTGAANGLSANMTFEFNLESLNIYYASNAGSATVVSVAGWTDKVNAN